MGLFDSTDWSDPATQAQMAFAANLMSSGKGLFPAYGDALKAAPAAAANAQAYKSNQIGIADNISKLQTWLGKTNHFRRGANLPDLTLDDLVKGNYSLLGPNGQPTAPDGSPSPQQAAQASPSAPVAVPAQANGSLFGGNPNSILASLQTTESGNNASAVSPKGATGLMQLMPATAANPGFGVAPAKDNSPEENQRVGDQYFQALEKKYGNAAHALVAYNWGPGNTDKWLKAGGDPSKIPAETQGEIAKVALRMAGGGSAAPTGAPQNVDPTLAANGNASAAAPQASQSAIPSDLGLYDPDQAIKNAEQQVRTLSPQEVASAGLPAGSMAQQDQFGKLDNVNTFGAVSPQAEAQQLAIWGQKSGAGAFGGADATPGASAKNANLHGPEYLGTLNPQLAATIKAVGDGRVGLATAMSRLPAGMKLGFQNAVNQYNPAYDEASMPMRRAAEISFGSGPDSKVIQSFNAASAHIASARPMLEALNNGNIPVFNQLAQEWAKQTGSPVPNNADMIKTLLGDELTKSIVGYQSAEGDRAAMQSPFAKANSPSQLLGALDTAEEFAAGQLRAEQKKYQFATHLQNFPDKLVPEAQAILARHPGASGGNSTTSSPTPSIPDTAKKQLKAGIVTTFGNGQKWTLDGSGNPQQVK